MEHVNDLTPHLGYTGALTDESGFVYLNARVYDPHLGIFLTGDTLEGTAANPGSFNRYGYVQGDPINAIDPSGHVLVDPGKGDFGGVGGGGYLGYGQMGGAASSGAGGTTISIVADTIEDGITIFRIINKAIRTILDAPIPTANSSTSQVAITMAPQATNPAITFPTFLAADATPKGRRLSSDGDDHISNDLNRKVIDDTIDNPDAVYEQDDYQGTNEEKDRVYVQKVIGESDKYTEVVRKPNGVIVHAQQVDGRTLKAHREKYGWGFQGGNPKFTEPGQDFWDKKPIPDKFKKE